MWPAIVKPPNPLLEDIMGSVSAATLSKKPDDALDDSGMI